jgi:hypothetical protein
MLCLQEMPYGEIVLCTASVFNISETVIHILIEIDIGICGETYLMYLILL